MHCTSFGLTKNKKGLEKRYREEKGISDRKNNLGVWRANLFAQESLDFAARDDRGIF